MTATPLFHETARQLWVNGQLSRESINRLLGSPPRQPVWTQAQIQRMIRTQARMRKIECAQCATAYVESQGLNARLDRLG